MLRVGGGAVIGVCKRWRVVRRRGLYPEEDLGGRSRWSGQRSFFARACLFSSPLKSMDNLKTLSEEQAQEVDNPTTPSEVQVPEMDPLSKDRVPNVGTLSENQVSMVDTLSVQMEAPSDIINSATTKWNGGIEKDVSLERNREEPEAVSVSEQKSIRVAIIGIPNAGKSTLINHLMQEKVLAVSPKVHTTSRKAIGVVTLGNTQIVLMDTPGIIPYNYAKSLGMSREFMADPGRSVDEADLVLVMADAANKFKREKLDPSIVKILRKNSDVKSVLVLNKVDIVASKFILLKLVHSITGTTECPSRDDEIGHLMRRLKSRKTPERVKNELRKRLSDIRYEEESSEPSVETDSEKKTEQHVITEWPHFNDIFMISALHGDGLTKLQNYIISNAKLREWEYHVSTVTDQPALNLVEDIIHEKLCYYYKEEIPYVVKQENFIWERDEDGKLIIYQYLHCGKKSRMVIILGKNGSRINTVKDEARRDIQKLFQCPVELMLHVKI